MNRATKVLPVGPLVIPKAKGRTTRREPGAMNGQEREYCNMLLADPGFARIEFERITFKLADDTRYTPDFFVVRTSGFIEFHEVKGFMEDDAWVKLKVCAEQHPWFTFVLARKRAKKNGGGWDVKVIGTQEA